MKRIIWYIRSCFCKHEFDKCETVYIRACQGEIVERKIRVSLICAKCGYHQSFDKF